MKGIWIVVVAMGLACGGAMAQQNPFPEVQTVDEFPWKDEGLMPLHAGWPFTTIMPGPLAHVAYIKSNTDPTVLELKVTYTGAGPYQLILLNLGQMEHFVPKAHYAFTGQVRTQEVSPGSFLELRTTLPQAAPVIFRATAERGPTARLDGTSDWRDFQLPIDTSGVTAPTRPENLMVNLCLNGPGTVQFRTLRLVLYPTDTSTSQAPLVNVRAESNTSLSQIWIRLDARPSGTVFSVDGSEWLALEDAPTRMKQLADAFKTSPDKLPSLVITGNPGAPFSDIARFLDAVKEAGFQRLEMSTSVAATPATASDATKPSAATFPATSAPPSTLAPPTPTPLARVPIENLRALYDVAVRDLQNSRQTLDNLQRNSPNADPSAISSLQQRIADREKLLNTVMDEMRRRDRVVIEWRSFFLGVMTLALTWAGAKALVFLSRLWSRRRHESELRRIASLDG